MEHIQNATLAGEYTNSFFEGASFYAPYHVIHTYIWFQGGVAMGTASDMNVEPVGALTIGFLAGALSTVGYAYIKVNHIWKYLTATFYIKPFLADKINLHDTCGVNNLHGMPAVMAAVISIIFCAINPTPYVVDEAEQGWLTQLYCLLCTLGCAIVGGLSKYRFFLFKPINHKNDDSFIFQLLVVSSESH